MTPPLSVADSDGRLFLFSPDLICAARRTSKSQTCSSKSQTSCSESSSEDHRPSCPTPGMFKMLRTDSKLIRAIMEGHGFQQSGIHSVNFDVLWSGNHLRAYCLRSLTPNQRVNHFPRSFELTRKDRLYRNIERMQIRCGKENFDFIPEFFVTPEEFERFKNSGFDRKKIDNSTAKNPFIVKPVGLSRGRGIFVALHVS